MDFRKTYQKIYYQYLKRHYFGITAKSRVLPDFLLIGAVRSGTTSLYYDICQHPSVHEAAYDEIGFFDDNFHLGEEWYRSLFPSKKKMFEIKQETGRSITGEDTPFYIWNDIVIDRIFNMLPNVKLISILRNPVDRAYSNYQLGLREGTERRTFRDAIEDDMKFLDKKKQEGYALTNDDYKKSYLAKGIYVEQLEKWFKVFRKEQFCIISTEDFSRKPDMTLKKIFNFLEITDYSIKKFEEKKKSKYNEMDDSLRIEVEEFFSEYNSRLYNLIDQEFDWMKN
tara:strand:- start:626 stop:1471 length:846 start_codon:yes stop_codon:yes gene_type:complete